MWYVYIIVLQADLVKGGGRKNLPPMHVHVVKYSWLGRVLYSWLGRSLEPLLLTLSQNWTKSGVMWCDYVNPVMIRK